MQIYHTECDRIDVSIQYQFSINQTMKRTINLERDYIEIYDHAQVLEMCSPELTLSLEECFMEK